MSDTTCAIQVAESLKTSGNPVKPANPRRGAKHRDAAVLFAEKYPIGSTLTWEEFTGFAVDAGLMEEEYLPTEAESADKNSNAWKAHIQRRHEAKNDLNKASRHPRLIPHGGAFSLDVVGGSLVVRSTVQAIAASEAPKRIASLATTKRRQLEEMIQSTDWSSLPPHERSMAEALRRDIDDWVAVVNLQAEQLERKFFDLGHHLKRLAEMDAVWSDSGRFDAAAKLLANDIE